MDLEEKVDKGIEVVREAYDKFDDPAIAWTGGKDSTLILHMVKEIHDGEIPSPALFIDSTFEFPETYEFVDKISEEWGVDVHVAKAEELVEKYHETEDEEKKKEIWHHMKIRAIDQALDENGWDALLVGIRWDEHPARSEETYFSPREDHTRVHPILHFTEADVWAYISSNDLPYHPLYDKGYRSIDAQGYTHPVEDPDAPERAGRDPEKEKIMQRLRELGYF